jgi:hypothetical protein
VLSSPPLAGREQARLLHHQAKLVARPELPGVPDPGAGLEERHDVTAEIVQPARVVQKLADRGALDEGMLQLQIYCDRGGKKIDADIAADVESYRQEFYKYDPRRMTPGRAISK